MVELNQIAPIPGGSVSDDDFLLVYDVQAGRAYRITRGQLLAGVARNLPPMTSGSVAVTMPIIAAGASQTITATLAGLTVGSAVTVTGDGAVLDAVTLRGWVSAPDTLTIAFRNHGAVATTAEQLTLRVVAWALQ